MIGQLAGLVLLLFSLTVIGWLGILGILDNIRDARRHGDIERIVAENEAIRLANGCGPTMPCDYEDGYECVWHRTEPHVYVHWDHCDRCYSTWETFQHQPSYGPEPVIGRCEWSDEMGRRFAE